MTNSKIFAIFFTAIFSIGELAHSAEFPNPYTATYGWEQMPAGNELGVPSGVYPDPDGEHIWIMDRCGGNNCAGSDRKPIHLFDADGHEVRSFGKGLLAWPHGFFIDAEKNIWVTEGAPVGDHRGEDGFAMGLGHQIFKFSYEGELLMTLGEAGVAGDDERHFNGPSGIAIAANGDIWITDGHRGGNNRVVRFDRDGNFIKALGGGVDDASDAPGLFNDPHGIAIDSTGRIFVADRGNNRIQILDSEGNYLDQWRHFGRPSGLYIDADDTLYSGDGMSDERRNPGYQKGIYIGSAVTGEVRAFIPDFLEYGANESGVEFLAPDRHGNIYAGEVTRQRLVKYIRE